MLCKVCVAMLRGGRGERWSGTHNLTFDHHKTTTSLRKSRESDCTICISLATALWRDMNLLEDRAISITAVLYPMSSGFSLNFDINRRFTRTYLLEEIDPNERRLRTLTSFNSSSDEVFQTAQNWLTKCKCASNWSDSQEKWYPKRLLDLKEIRRILGFGMRDSLTVLSKHSDSERAKIYLVETDGLFVQSASIPGHPTTLWTKLKSYDLRKMVKIEREDCRYVTLSHCWGNARTAQKQLKLDHRTEHHFKQDGIELRELPKTFRDAILFACRLEKVGFIWIDSLCIVQPTEDYPHQSDWIEQSREMDQIYRCSFLNISAAAAADGDRGLFVDRRPEYLWEDEVNVSNTGVHTLNSERREGTGTNVVRRCTLIDPSLWDELVEDAPLNRRGWVVQERLMSPRVLHFCHNQIAWECAEFDDCEAHNELNLTPRTKQGSTMNEGRFKNLTPQAGLALRNQRLNGLSDPDEGMQDLYVFELWKRVVEVYSRTQLTVSRDKLIALSGIARHFCAKDTGLFTAPSDYIAGMWSNHLESQLLWQVNELFRDGVFENPARRDATRAPSFSWASIDSPHGITYADVTDYKRTVTSRIRTRAQDHTEEPLLHVRGHYINLSDKSNKFGMVDQGSLFVKPRFLRAIELRRLHPRLSVPYSWRLRPDYTVHQTSAQHLEHANLYLDAPESDVDIFYDDADLHCMPVAYGERTVREPFRYLYCLLLKYKGQTVWPSGEKPTMRNSYPMFKRVGITKLSNHSDEKGQEALMSDKYNGNICLC